MKIADKFVVSMHYTLTDDQGQTIDSSRDGEAMPYLHGGNNIVPGLEQALTGLEKGATIQVVVQPEDAYGPVMEEAIQTIPREAFGDIEDIKPGMQFQAQGPEGQVQVITIKDVVEDGILVDGNHPLAGMVLNFDVEIMDVREATEEELAHGHPHHPGQGCGEGGCGEEGHQKGGCGDGNCGC